MKYTKDISNQKYFLNDKNVSLALSDDSDGLNTIPSLTLVSTLYNELSAEDKRLNDYISDVEVSADGISSIVNSLCTLISNDITAKYDTLDTKINTLSTDLSGRIEALSSDLCSTVNAEFVHKAGDSIHHLTVDNQLTVNGQTTIQNELIIKGNLVQGEESGIPSVVRAVALGRKAQATTDGAFVWNGNNDAEYADHGHSTFNINPENGTKGFYVGTTTLSDLIHNDVELTANAMYSYVNGISNELSTTIDTNRGTDKSELTYELSTYTNNSINALCGAVDYRRTNDKSELSNVLSTYSNSLCVGISGTVDADKYGVASTLSIDYDKPSRNIIALIKNKFGEITTSLFSFDKITESQIVDRVEVLTPPTPGIEVPTIRIWWMPKPAAGETLKSTDIPVADLAQVYRAGFGIDITPDLSIQVDGDVAKTVDLNATNATVNELSTTTYNKLTADTNTVSANLKVVQGYVNDLSCKNGLIDQLSDGIKDINDYLYDDVDKRFLSNEQNISKVSVDVGSIQGYVNQLSCKNGIVDTLSDDVTDIYTKIRHQMAFTGHIKVNYANIKNLLPQEWVSEYGNNLSSIFRNFNFPESGKIQNGAVYEVKFTNTALYDTVDDKANFEYTTDDGFTVKHGDYLIAHSCDGHDTISIYDIGPDTVYVIPSVRFSEHYQLSAAVRDNYIWLSGGNSLTATWDIDHTDHSIGGDNDFMGYNRFEEVSAYSISAQLLSASDVEIDDLSAYKANIFDLSVGNNLSVQNKLSVATEVDFLSGNVTINDELVTSKYKVYVENNVEVSGNVEIDDKLSVHDSIVWSEVSTVINNNFAVRQNAWIESKLTVKDAIEANSTDVIIHPSTHLKNTLSVDGTTNLDGTLTVKDDKATVLGGTLQVKKDATFNDNVQINDNLTVDNKLTANTLFIVEIPATFKNTLSVCNNSTLDGTLNVLSATTLDDTLTVADNKKTTLGGELQVKNAAVFNSTVQTNNNLTVDNTLTATVTNNTVDIVNLSVGTLSADWNEIKHTTGFSLFELSTALSNKIFIDDRVNHDINGTSDLSIVKISKEDYDRNVALGTTPLCANTLYVVDSNYIDAYGQVLSNLTMSIDSNPTEAANQHYVDTLSTNLSTEISAFIKGTYDEFAKTLQNNDGTVKQVNQIKIDDVISCMYNFMTFVKNFRI